MSVIDFITGNAISIDSLKGSFGEFTGKSGVIMTWLNDHLADQATIVVWVFMAATLALLARSMISKSGDGDKGAGLPIGVMLLLSNFMFDEPMSTIVLIGAMITAVGFIVINHESISNSHILGLLALICTTSYFIMGNAATLAITGVIAGGVFYVLKRTVTKEKGESHKSKKLRRSQGFDDRPEIKAIHQEEKAEHRAHKSDDMGKATEELAKVEERNIEMELHSSTLAAGVEKISKEMLALDNAEITAEARDAKLLNFAGAVSENMKKHALENEDDAKKTADLKADAKRQVMVLGEVVNDEKYTHHYRKHTVKAILMTTDVMNEAAHYAKKILGSEIKEENKVRIAADKAIKTLGKDLKGKRKAVTKAYKSLSKAGLTAEAKKKANDSMHKLADEAHNLEKQYAEAQKIMAMIDDVAKKGRRVLRMMKGEAIKLAGIEDNIDGIAQRMEALESHVGKHVAHLQDAYKAFQQDMAKVDKDDLPEAVVMQAQAHATQVFDTALNYIKETMKFNKEEVLPFIQHNGELVKSSWRMEKAADFANKVSTKVTDALMQLATMEMSILSDHKKMKQMEEIVSIDKFQKKISNYADWKANKIKTKAKKSYGDLGQAMKSVQTQIGYLEAEQSSMANAKTKTIDSLRIAIDALEKIRKKQFQQFQKAAGTAQADLNAAKNLERKEKAQVAKAS